ncbi:hypothetical protein A5696_08225 [Mycobacterium sp. E2699]|uniref:hypothetical protein n=1 Tax=Mycobacterium sp. E2699 TaxID=1834137 RepID=UPI0008025665|nr:hypothetical protein [Mycobacterium sp. E2699]OBH03432.1 hypothetical protein A5696_08225 [Mycobacterium sp. E2699]
MTSRGTREARRWRSAIAIVATLGVFVALVAGSALRPQFAAAAPPEPAAWSQAIPDAGAHASHDAAPTHKKPFHATWMTKDRPPAWSPVSPPLVAQVSFAAFGFQPRGARPCAPAAIRAGPDILTRFCVARR